MSSAGLPIRERIAREQETVQTAIRLLFTLYGGMADAADGGSEQSPTAEIEKLAASSLQSMSYLQELPDRTAALTEAARACADACTALQTASAAAESVEAIQTELLAYGEQLQALADAAAQYPEDLKKAAGGRLYMELEALAAAAKQLKKMGLTHILDYGCALDRAEVIGRNLAGQYTCEELHFDGVCEDETAVTPLLVPYLYERLYRLTEHGEEVSLIPVSHVGERKEIGGTGDGPEASAKISYDAVLLMNLYDGTNVTELVELLRRVEKQAPYTFFNLLPDRRGDYAPLREELTAVPRYMTIAEGEHILVIVDNTAASYTGRAAIYAVTHKPFRCPAYPMYHPIHAGRIDKEDLGYPGDHTGDNISALNPYINECTALYWMWKNDRHPIVGLNHYRRYFAPQGMNHANDWFLTEEILTDIMTRCDMILANVAYCYPMTIEQHLQKMFDYSRASLEGPGILREILAKHQPDYVAYYDRVMQGHTFYLCNLFITTHQILDDYCSWLFSFLPEATVAVNEAMGTDGFRDAKDMRIVGFLAERLLTVWLLGQHLRIECLPIINGGNL